VATRRRFVLARIGCHNFASLRSRWAVSSAVEHCFHTAGVTGSIPVPPTIDFEGIFTVFLFLRHPVQSRVRLSAESVANRPAGLALRMGCPYISAAVRPLLSGRAAPCPHLLGAYHFYGAKSMDRFVILVDAGYLLHKGVEIVSSRASTERRDLDLADAPALIALLIRQAKLALGLEGKELLRLYWYDGVMSGGLTPQQRAICELPDVNFRAGLVNSRGQQKGVDSLIVTDLFELASNRAVTDAALVTGDSDLAIGIDLAQKKGVRVAVIGLEDHTVGVSSGQSREITDRADRVVRFGGTDLTPVMKYTPRIAITVTSAQAGTAPIRAVPQAVATTTRVVASGALNNAEKAAIDNAVKAYIAANLPAAGVVDASTKRIDALVDRTLIHYVFTSLAHGALTGPEKIHARECFRKQLGF
jgi:uncharacterized LabA/DUF88 family protein